MDRISLERAKDIAHNLLTMNDAWCKKIDVVGSIRRERPTINDIDFVVIATDSGWNSIEGNMVITFRARYVLSGSKILRFMVPFKNDLQVDFYRGDESNYGILKLVRTGSAEHNIWLARYAIGKGMRLQYSKGLTEKGEVIAGRTEEGVFKALGLDYIIPSEREMVSGKPVWMK